LVGKKAVGMDYSLVEMMADWMGEPRVAKLTDSSGKYSERKMVVSKVAMWVVTMADQMAVTMVETMVEMMAAKMVVM